MINTDLVIRGVICFLILLTSHVQFAQNDLLVHHRLENGVLKIRLAPGSTREFPRPADRSYYVDLYAIDNEAPPTLIYQDELKPLAYDDWMRSAEVLSDSGGIAAIHFEAPEAAELRQILEEDLEGRLTPDLYDMVRFNLLEESNRNSFPAAQRSGYAFSFNVPPNTSVIGGKVHTPGLSDTFYFDLPIANYQPVAVPELRVIWKSRNAYLSWRTTEYREDYWGWVIEKSVNGGPFVPQYDVPLENTFDTIVGAPDTANYLTHRDPRIDNDDEITYRLYGIDYLGMKSLVFDEVTGGGISDIQNSPLLIEGIQTDSNYAEYVIVHRDTLAGEYETVLAGISPSAREASVPMKFRSNYYRVQALSIRRYHEISPAILIRSAWFTSAGQLVTRWISMATTSSKASRKNWRKQ